MNKQAQRFFRVLGALCAVFLSTSTTNAQSVTTNAVTTTTYCPADSISVSYAADGAFGAKNAFALQLSGPDGSFGGSFLTLGSVRSTTSGTIAAPIPRNVAAGTHYRVRVISSNPYIVGTDNGADLSIGATPSANFWPSKTLAMVGDTIFFAASGADSGSALSFNWDFGVDATPSTSTSRSVAVVYSMGGPKTTTLTVTGQYGCTSTNVMRADSSLSLAMKGEGLTIIDCNVRIPSGALIDSTEDPSGPSGGGIVAWVVPGATYFGTGGSMVVFAEPGARIITGGSGSCTFYLKDGSSLELGGGGGHIIVAGNGAGLSLSGGATIFRCPNLSFNYTEAPPYKFRPAGVPTTFGAKLTLYPNPAASMLFVELPQAPKAVTVRDERGVELLSTSGDFTSLLQIDVRSFAAGTYFLELQYPEARTVDRFVVTR